MAAIYYLTFGNATVAVCIALWRPWSPEFLSSMLSPGYGMFLSGLVRLGNAAFMAYIAYSFHENAIMYLHFMVTILASMADMLSE